MAVGIPRVEAPFDAVAFTRSASRAYNRSRSRIRDLFIDVYSTVLALGVVAAMAGSLVLSLREQLALAVQKQAAGLADAQWTAIPQGVFLVGLVFAALVSTAVLARKLGPVTVQRPESYWWLSLPLDRRPLLSGRFFRRILAVGFGMAAGYVPFSLLTALDAAAAAHLRGAAVFGLAAMSVVLTTALRQGASRGPLAGIVPTLLLAAVLVPLPGIAVSGASWPIAAVFSLAVVLWCILWPRLGQIPGQDLIRGGAVSGHTGSALYFMDLNELTRALASPERGAGAGNRARRFYARPTAGPGPALLRADIVAFLRAPGLVLKPALLLLLCTAVVLVEDGLPVAGQLGVITATGCAVASVLGVVARRTAISPGVDALLPLAPALVLLSRMFMPALALAVWMGLFTAGLVVLGAGDGALIGLGITAGVGMAAGAVRGGYRQPPDWSQPPVETPFGPVPRAQAGALLRGFDVVVISLVPVLFALYLGQTPALLIVTQLAATTVGVLMALFPQPATKGA